MIFIISIIITIIVGLGSRTQICSILTFLFTYTQNRAERSFIGTGCHLFFLLAPSFLSPPLDFNICLAFSCRFVCTKCLLLLFSRVIKRLVFVSHLHYSSSTHTLTALSDTLISFDSGSARYLKKKSCIGTIY